MTLVSGMKFLGRKFGFLEKIEEGNYRDKLNKSPKQKHKGGLIRLHMLQTSETLAFVQCVVGFSAHHYFAVVSF